MSKSITSKKVERIYDNKSHAELRQLAKGAVLSLVPHKILYGELIREGVDPQILRTLYEELGLKAEPSQAPPTTDGQDATMTDVPTFTSEEHPTIKTAEATIQSTDVAGVSPPTTIASSAALPSTDIEVVPPPAILDLRNSQSAPSPSLERKDRIAQLLAAKAGRPTPPPTNATSALRDETTAQLPVKTSANTSEVVAIPSASQALPVNPAGAFALQSSTTTTKSKAQTELVKQKMEQLRREAQARAEAGASSDGLKLTPQFGSVTPLSTTKMLPFASQPALTSSIPGLFMSSLESSRADDSTDVSSPFQRLASSSVPAKHTLDTEPSSLPSQHPSKKARTEPNLPPTAFFADQDNDVEEQSEGEVVEESEADAGTFDQEPEQTLPEYQPSEFTATTTGDPNQDMFLDQSSTATSQNLPSTGPGGNQLYRAKQTEIETMRRKIAELERTKLKRTRSQMESPTSSKPATPTVAGEDHPLSSSPIAHFADLSGSRQPSGIRTASRLTREQLQERAATLKAEVLRRTQRQQVLQAELPGLTAEVSETESRLDTSRKELAKVRAQMQGLHAELDRLAVQEKALDEEVTSFEQQLQEGLEGQKQYSNELQKLTEDDATPVQQEPEAIFYDQPLASVVSQAYTGAGNGHVADQDLSNSSVQLPPDSAADSAAATYTVDDEGDIEMQAKDYDDSYMAGQTEEPGYENTETTSTSEGPTGNEQEMQIDAVEESSAPEEPESTDAQLQAALDDQLGAGDMEISPEPEDLEESHESQPAALDPIQDFTDEAVDMNDDSDGSASMSDSDEEEDYEPAEAHASITMQQSEEEEEYDPETAPVDSGMPTPAIEDAYEPHQDQSLHINPSEAVPELSEGELSVNGVSPVESNVAVVGMTLDNVTAVSEVPADTQDDLESRAQLTEADYLVKPPPGQSRQIDAAPLLDGSATPSVHYVPYKTPLSSFRSYRFHSDFNDTVKSGYRSLTYSNNIDPTRPLCPTELSGQVCADTTCEEQHFSQLGLPDEKILVQMSSTSDIKDKAVKEDFHAGLKGVIAELRAKEVKDFEKVADALSKYRRAFFAEREEKDGQEGEVKPKEDAGADEGQVMEAS